VHHESIDLSIAWKQSRYDKGGPAGDGADYLNCPLNKEEYEAFVAALLAGDKTEFKEWEHNTPYFNGCQPIEVIAASGPQTLRFGPMKPVGLRDPRTGHRPWAVVQLRQDNALGTLWNIVGFQTKLKHGEQTRLFRTIPGLQGAEFARLGGLHRNTFLNSPRLLDATLRLKSMPRLRFAGQITGCEGYVESAAMGLLAGRFAAAERRGETLVPPPRTTAHGALVAYITGDHVGTIDAGPRSYQPMNVNFGLFPPLATVPSKSPDGTRLRGTAKTLAKRRALCARALADLEQWIGGARLAAE
jgi:methylenetetrahydrofolate--tRNA-(uracil-5-)-methyltransferase